MSKPAHLWLTLLLAGVVLAAVSWRQSARIAALESRPAATHGGEERADEVADLVVRVKALEDDLAELRADAAHAAPEPAPAPRAGHRWVVPLPARDGSSAGTPAPQVVREAAVAALTGDDERVRGHLRELIQDERQAERAERFEAMQSAMTERVTERVAQLAETAALSEPQRRDVQARLALEQATVMGLFRDARRDGTWGDARQAAEEVRRGTDEQLRALLDPAQYEAYTTMRKETRWGPGRGGRRWGGPPPD